MAARTQCLGTVGSNDANSFRSWSIVLLQLAGTTRHVLRVLYAVAQGEREKGRARDEQKREDERQRTSPTRSVRFRWWHWQTLHLAEVSCGLRELEGNFDKVH